MKLTRVLTPVVLSPFLFALTAACGGSPAPAATVEVALKEFAVNPSVSEVPAGKIRFVATNQGTMVHELAVLSTTAEGSKHEVAEAEGIKVGQKAQFTAKLKPGRYELACLVAPGEQGSTVDHYQQGMHTAFTVK